MNVEVGGLQASTVTGIYSDDSTHAVNFGSTFVSSAPAVAKADSSTGFLTGLTALNAMITATHTASGNTGTVTVTVNASSGSTGTCAAPSCTDFSAAGVAPLGFASGYASNNRTVEGGEWGFHSGNFTNYSNTYTGGGFVDGAAAVPAADSYIYLVVATSAPTTGGYIGIFTGAPRYTIAAPNAGVTLTGQGNLKIELGMAAAWFQQATNKQLTVRLIGSQVYSDGSGGRCQILVEKLVTPTTADLTLYTIALNSMTLAQACNGGGFASGVTTLAEALARPIGEVHVQAIFPQLNTTVQAGTEYPTGFTRGSVSFE